MSLDWLPTAKEVKQGSELWKTWRGYGLGSSDAPVLLGVSPWKTVYQLWLEKTDQVPDDKKFTGNWATKRGNDLEPKARDLYNRRYGCDMYVAQAEHPDNKVWRASFDGIDHAVQRVLEVKCPGKIDHQSAVEGIVPEKYVPQCQWLMLVAGYTELDYVSYDGTESDDDTLWHEGHIVCVRVSADPAMQAALMARAAWFWDLVTRREPPPTEEAIIEEAELIAALDEYEEIRNRMRMDDVRLGMLKLTIGKYSKAEVSRCGEYKIAWSERKGAVDYAKVPALEGVDLDPYRKPATRTLLITRSKK